MSKYKEYNGFDDNIDYDEIRKLAFRYRELKELIPETARSVALIKRLINKNEVKLRFYGRKIVSISRFVISINGSQSLHVISNTMNRNNKWRRKYSNIEYFNNILIGKCKMHQERLEVMINSLESVVKRLDETGVDKSYIELFKRFPNL